MTAIPSPDEPTPEDIARFLGEAEQQFVLTPDPDGYTPEVARREAFVAEADRLRDLPTNKVLKREAELEEQHVLAALDTKALESKLRDQGERERAKLTAKAASAAARRAIDTDTHVRALLMTRRRTARLAMLWAVLGLALAYTAVNVQRFAAGGTTAADPRWWVAWAVDPVLSALVVALLLTKGDLAGVTLSESPGGRRAVKGVEIGALLAQLLMNVAPTIPGAWQVVALHVVIPLAAVAAAVVLPVVQRRYVVAIAELAAVDMTVTAAPGVPPTGGIIIPPTGLSTGPTGPEYRENIITPVGGTPASVPRTTEELVARARELVASGALPPDPSATTLRNALRVGTNAARLVRDALHRLDR